MTIALRISDRTFRLEPQRRDRICSYRLCWHIASTKHGSSLPWNHWLATVICGKTYDVLITPKPYAMRRRG
jgi:hypothetical protein